jgi:hypothetical protein
VDFLVYSRYPREYRVTDKEVLSHMSFDELNKDSVQIDINGSPLAFNFFIAVIHGEQIADLFLTLRKLKLR